MKPHVIAFYSYRGGVGRSTALCNVAARMATEGDRVLVIDLDLQAPGASIILGGADYAGKEVRGIVDEINQARTDTRKPDFSNCVRHMRLGAKSFWLMPSGRLDQHYPGNADAAEISYLSAATPEFVNEVLNALLEYVSKDGFHYVLIDCRPGLSKVSLLAIEKLAESVVILFGLDRQSLLGVGWTREKFHSLGKNLHLVASRTPTRVDTRQALEDASKAWEDPVLVTLSFDESMLLRERIVFSTEKTQLALDYDVLTTIVRSPEDIASLVADGRRLLGESGGAITAHARFQRAHVLDRKDVRPLAALAHYYTVANLYTDAIKNLELAVEADGDYSECWQAADALARQPLLPEIQTRLEKIYQKVPSKSVSGSLISQLATFSLQIREATKPGNEFALEVAKAFSPATLAAGTDQGIWQEFINRIPLPSSGGDARQFIVELIEACQQSLALVEAAKQLRDFLLTWTQEISGVVTRFGNDGFGFLASDDGQNDIFFRRGHCVSYGRDAFDFISVGETAVFDLRYGEDRRWQAQNVRFPSVEPGLAAA